MTHRFAHSIEPFGGLVLSPTTTSSPGGPAAHEPQGLTCAIQQPLRPAVPCSVIAPRGGKHGEERHAHILDPNLSLLYAHNSSLQKARVEFSRET